MTGKILFLAPYPDKKNIRDGMIIRVGAIDRLFRNHPRTYLYISLRKNWKKKIDLNTDLEIYHLNLLLHFYLICRIIFSASNIYIHSIHMVRNVFYLLPFLGSKQIVLDAHGAVPEEEIYYKNRKLLVLLYTAIERTVFRYVSTVICVTHSMKDHFIAKYPQYKGKYLIYSIFPSDFSQNVELEYSDKIVDWGNEKVIVIYSGGPASWQKVDLMLKTIKYIQSPRIQYIILSGQIDYFKEMICKMQIPMDNLLLDSVDPSRLHDYYEIADYGFILRDDNPVNHVANPTKLVEYMYYGIIPIVLTPHIGDYYRLGMTYIPIADFDAQIPKPAKRCAKNMAIVRQMLSENAEFSFSRIFE